MGALYSRLASSPTGAHSACSAHCALQIAALAADLTQLRGEHSEEVAEQRQRCAQHESALQLHESDHRRARGGVGRGAHPQQGLHTDARADRAPAHN